MDRISPAATLAGRDGQTMTAGNRSGLLAPFKVRGFLFQWPADLLINWGIEVEILVLGWYILVETQSVLLLTLFGASAFLRAQTPPPLVAEEVCA